MSGGCFIWTIVLIILSCPLVLAIGGSITGFELWLRVICSAYLLCWVIPSIVVSGIIAVKERREND